LRAFGLGLMLAILALPVAAQDLPRAPGDENRTVSTKDLLKDPVMPKGTDPEAHDAIDLFARLCVSTRGDRARGISIIGEGDSAIEKMDDPLLRGLEGGASGGVGWIVRMPLGDKILLEFTPDGSCVVRAPRVNNAQLEFALRNLLDQYSASGQFLVHRAGDGTKTIKVAPRRSDGEAGSAGEQDKTAEKVKYHIVSYNMTLPDIGKTADLMVATTDSGNVSIQGVLSFQITTPKP
jgi:hypothetical protein